MMTTESPFRGLSPLVAAALVTVLLGGVLATVGALVDGSAAAYGALTGTAIAVGIFGLGTFAVDAVAKVMPVASLLIAMMTYGVQVLLLALVFVAFNQSGLLDSELDRAWLGGAIILGALAWSFTQIRATATARIPVYDTPVEQPVNASEGRFDRATEGGAR
jgi:ATP synthase protein I